MAKKVQQLAPDGNPEDLKGLHPVVAAISKLEFQGNLIPHSWWHSEKLRFSNGQPNFTAMLILADICYWYRATEKRDASGKVVELRQKFSANMLQKSYKEWAEQFALSKRQIQDAATFLVERGLVKRELRSFESRGVWLYNVTFFEPDPVAIRDLTLSRPDVGGITSERDTSHATTGHLSRQNVIPITSGRDTYTNNRQKTNPENGQRPDSVCVAGATPADADTHTSRALARSVGKQKKSDHANEFPRLTEKQAIVYKILRTYFPSLGTQANRIEFARVVQERDMTPFEAALMCAWLEANERKFAFMKLTLFRELLAEFDAHPDDEDLDGARYFFEIEEMPRSSKLDAVIALYREWDKKGAAK